MTEINCRFYSPVLGMQQQMKVLLPGSPKTVNEKIPLLYLLSPSRLYHNNIENHALAKMLETTALSLGMAVAIPDAGQCFYTNMEYGYDYFSFFAQELQKSTAEFFPNFHTTGQNTYVAGIGTGGYGAVKLLLNNPGNFNSALCFYSPLDGNALFNPETKNTKRRINVLDNALANNFGNKEMFENSEENNLYNIINNKIKQNLKLPDIHLFYEENKPFYQSGKSFYHSFKNKLNLGIYEDKEMFYHKWPALEHVLNTAVKEAQ